jgi:hypothetical protein
MRAAADAAIASYRGRVRRLPMIAALRCRSCGHHGNARVPPGGLGASSLPSGTAWLPVRA